MDDKPLFAKFWVDESKTTSKVLSRIPEGSTYRPDPKSRIASEIAWLIVCEEKMLMDAIESGKGAWDPAPIPTSMKDIRMTYDAQAAHIAVKISELSAAKWNGSLDWFGKPRQVSPMAWGFLFDIVHHRGQITTYLRAMGSTVPQIYGPSADEP